VILHLVAEPDWLSLEPGAPTYVPASLATEGFVHCTGDDELLLEVATTYYRSTPGPFLVLTIDERLLHSEVRWEPGQPAPPPGAAAARFPHVYGPIDTNAVVGVRRAKREADGRFVGFCPYAATA